MTKEQYRSFRDEKFKECAVTSNLAQGEYASEDDAFQNFKTAGEDMEVSDKKVLYIFLKKHIDGIRAYLRNPATAQREPVQGRIKDAINFLMLLWAMVEEEEMIGNLGKPGRMINLPPGMSVEEFINRYEHGEVVRSTGVV
jgi:hypothetical protein